MSYKVWNIEHIKDFLKTLGEKYKLSCINIPVRISKRMTRALGLYVYKKNTLQPVEFVFSAYLLDGSYSEKEVMQVITHEFCHYYTDTIEGKPCKHNNKFKRNCILMGITDNTYSNYKLSDKLLEKVEKSYKYKIVCNNCGYTIKRKRIRKNFTKNYRCGKCLGTLKVIELQK